jgi:hypothetical protein
MSAAKALARTVDLVRADIFPDVDDDDVVAALTGVRMRLVADERNLSCATGQTALVTTAIVAAQSGAELVLDLPDVPLIGDQPPLRGRQVGEALLELTSDLIVPAIRGDGQRSDLTLVLGSTRVSAAPDGFASRPSRTVSNSFREIPSALEPGSATGCSARSSVAWPPAARPSERPCAGCPHAATTHGLGMPLGSCKRSGFECPSRGGIRPSGGST